MFLNKIERNYQSKKTREAKLKGERKDLVLLLLFISSSSGSLRAHVSGSLPRTEHPTRRGIMVHTAFPQCLGDLSVSLCCLTYTICHLGRCTQPLHSCPRKGTREPQAQEEDPSPHRSRYLCVCSSPFQTFPSNSPIEAPAVETSPETWPPPLLLHKSPFGHCKRNHENQTVKEQNKTNKTHWMMSLEL